MRRIEALAKLGALWHHHAMKQKHVAIIGGGPAGLAAAEVLCDAGLKVTIYEAMPTPARKFLLAGKSGLNITHAEPSPAFNAKFSNSLPFLADALNGFGADAVRQWAASLDTETFVGSSGRVFPKAMKASPLLRAWLHRLEQAGAQLVTRHRWCGFEGNDLLFDTPDGRVSKYHDAVLLALGGASWPRLGSDAAWVPVLEERGVTVRPFRPANCGFDVAWSPSFADKFAGAPVKSVVARSNAGAFSGEFVVSASGIEGSLVYAHAAALRDALERDGAATLELDLCPGRSPERLTADLQRQNPKQSLSNRLRKGAGLTGVKAALLRELAPEALTGGPETLAKNIKHLKLPVVRPRPIAEAISSAGGIDWSQLDENYMLRALPGTFVAGEMIDWEAPTGGYLLTACLATGRAAGHGLLKWLRQADETSAL